MKKLFLMVAMVLVSIVAMAQTNQLVWANGQLLYATPTDRVDSLTYDASFEGDTLFFIMPHRLVQTVHDTVFVHDTLYEEKIVYVHDTIYINNCEPEEPETTHEYVDLGLSVKWATCNVGATTPEEYGDYFAWGEVVPKENYDWDTYKFGVTSNELTKYCSDSEYGKDGFTDNKTILDPEDDAATVNWGGAWRMPTKEEQDELRNNCTWTWVTQNGVDGYLVTSNIVGYTDRSIFLPASGCMISGDLFYGDGFLGNYWSSSLNVSEHPDGAYDICFFPDNDIDCLIDGRANGYSVRPVCK